MTKTQRFIFDSFLRYSGTNNNPKFVIPNVGIKATRVYVNTVSIPHSFYNVTTSNNQISFYASDDPTRLSLINSTITPGNYTISEILTEVGTQMTADTTDGLTYTATKDSKTNKTTITNSGPTAFALYSGYPDILTMLGFHGAESEDDFISDSGRLGAVIFNGLSSYVSNASYYVSPNSIFVRSNIARKTTDYKSNAFVYTYNPTNSSFIIDSGKSDFLLHLPVTTNFGDMIEWRAGNSPVRMALSETSITEVEFELHVGSEYNRLNLNGRAWTIELVFEC
jgi:hypothetical protein